MSHSKVILNVRTNKK